MSVRINLANHKNDDYYTNFDIVEGNVVLSLNSAETITSVIVKVEGLSRSLCYTEPGSGKTRSKTPVEEIHKVLYLTNTVFPDEQIRRNSSAASYTLPPGKHTWPFKFQIPVNNDCKEETRLKSSLGSLMLGPIGPQRHVQQILPPSMSGSEEAWVRYFVKVTVIRPSMLAMNRRTFAPFIFLPIEAPRAEQPDGAHAFFVKRQHTLQAIDETKRSGLRSLLRESRNKLGDTIAIEVRMPNPPSLVPGIPVDMNIMGFIESNHNNNNLRIVKVVIHLGTVTKVRAGGLKRTLIGRHLSYTSEFDARFTPHDDPEQPAIVLPLAQVQPFIVATETPPTFSTCNLARVYSLEIAVTVEQIRTRDKDVVVLNCPVTILSGVSAPPPQEVERPYEAQQQDSNGNAGSFKTSGPGPSSSVGGGGGSSHQDMEDGDLPSYREAVQVGAPSSRPRVPVMTSRTAMRTRTSYRVGQDYYQPPPQGQ